MGYIKSMGIEKLEKLLNNAAKKAGKKADYTLTSYTDATDSYADYCGYIINGDDVPRAQAYIIEILKRYNKTRRYCPGSTLKAELRTHGDVEYVCRGRFSLGD